MSENYYQKISESGYRNISENLGEKILENIGLYLDKYRLFKVNRFVVGSWVVQGWYKE